MGALEELFDFPSTGSGGFVGLHSIYCWLWGSLSWCGFIAGAAAAQHARHCMSECVTLKGKSNQIALKSRTLLGWISTLTTAEPTATPPAVAAICLKRDGCWGAAATGAAATGAGGGAGATRAGTLDGTGLEGRTG